MTGQDSQVKEYVTLVIGIVLGLEGIYQFIASVLGHSVSLIAGYAGIFFLIGGHAVAMDLMNRRYSDSTFWKWITACWAILSGGVLMAHWIWEPIMPVWKIPVALGMFIACMIVAIHLDRKYQEIS